MVIALPAALPAQQVTYADIAPVLAARCVPCHQGPAAPLGLRLDTRDGLLAGSRKGPVAVAGDPDASELARRLTGASLPRMPMTGPPFLDDGEITLFEQWIEQGMPGGAVDAARGAAASEPEPGRTTAAPVAGPVTWADVAVVLATRCAGCHAEDGVMGPAPEDYRLTSYAAAVSAAERARVVPGNPAASELVRRVQGQARPRMPFDGPPYLSTAEIALIEQWILDGARNAAGTPAPLPIGRPVRLHGTLAAGGRLDGLGLAMTPETRRDEDPRPGDYVRVRGTVGADGGILVERIRRR